MPKTKAAPVTVTRPCPAQLTEARGWLKDCGWQLTEQIETTAVVRLVNANYEGGWPAFLEATAELATA
jgi:hypothetical protein